MDNKLAKRVYLVDKKQNSSSIGIVEANVAYFIFLIINAFPILFLPLFYGKISTNTCIMFAIMFIIASIFIFVMGVIFSKKNSKFKVLYYIDFILLAFSVFMSVLAIITHFQSIITFTHTIVIFGILTTLSILDFIVLSYGKKERLLFSLMCIVFIAVIILACMSQNIRILNGSGYAMLAYSIVLLILHLTMLGYIFSGEGFYILMSFSYLFLAIAAAIIAIAISGGGDFSCDCGDCTPIAEGGRRGKTKKLKIDQVISPEILQ